MSTYWLERIKLSTTKSTVRALINTRSLHRAVSFAPGLTHTEWVYIVQQLTTRIQRQTLLFFFRSWGFWKSCPSAFPTAAWQLFFLIKLCTTDVVLTHTSTVSQMVSVPVHLPLKRHDANGAFFDGSKSSTFWRAGNRKLASFLHYHWTSNGTNMYNQETSTTAKRNVAIKNVKSTHCGSRVGLDPGVSLTWNSFTEKLSRQMW